MEQLQDWVGRFEESCDTCALILVQRLAALLDKEPDSYRNGAELPQGWHVCLFTARPRQSELGPDGHPREDTLMPPAPLPRRVLGGRRTFYHAPLIIGGDYRRRNEIVSISRKESKSGGFVLITTRSTIHDARDGRPVLVEEQDSIYQPEKREGQGSDPVTPQRPADPAFMREVTFNPTMLFRYSAVTFNTHRIHYDLPYVTGEEKYAGLMVNGGFTALLLVELFAAHVGRRISSTTLRNRAAVICGGSFRLCGAPVDRDWILWVEDARTSQIMLECRVQ